VHVLRRTGYPTAAASTLHSVRRYVLVCRLAEEGGVLILPHVAVLESQREDTDTNMIVHLGAVYSQ
jgi:hypothetical protein